MSRTSNAVRVRVGTQWHTPADALCCPVSTYEFEAAADSNGFYRVVKDERPTVGAYVLHDDQPRLHVVAVVPGVPADGKL